MTAYAVQIKSLQKNVNDFEKYEKFLKQYSDRVDEIRNSLYLSDSTTWSIKNSLRTIANVIEDEARVGKNMSNQIEKIAKKYEVAENKICGNSKASWIEFGKDNTGKVSGGGTSTGMIIGSKNYGNVDYQKTDENYSWWNKYVESFGDNFSSNLRDALLESTGNTIVKVGGAINVITALARSNLGENGFVIVNPVVASKTAGWISFGKNLAVGAKYGLPIIGGIIDYASIRSSGKSVKESVVKAGAHVGIGWTAGALGGAMGTKIGGAVGVAVGSIIPGAGTVVGGAVGAAVGFISGVAITTIGNAAFDFLYDNREAIEDGASNVINVVKRAGRKIGNAISSGVNRIGMAFG